MGAPQKIPSSGFALTYIENVALEQLQAEYDELNATHQSIFEEYTELKAGIKDEVDSTRNLMYVFIVTTVVASITVVILLMRKPKKVWV
jgi:predicted transcriptional regulator